MSKGSWKRDVDVPRESKAVVEVPLVMGMTTHIVTTEAVVVGQVVEVPAPVHQNTDIITWVGDVPYCYRCEQGPEVMGDGSMGHQEMRVELDRWVCPRCSSWEKR